jgi:rhodanese-related sulfurtransferase
MFKKNGFKKTYALLGGFNEWVRAGLPIEAK